MAAINDKYPPTLNLCTKIMTYSEVAYAVVVASYLFPLEILQVTFMQDFCSIVRNIGGIFTNMQNKTKREAQKKDHDKK